MSYGPQPLLMPFTTLGAGDALRWIEEWRPQDFGHFGAFELLLSAVQDVQEGRDPLFVERDGAPDALAGMRVEVIVETPPAKSPDLVPAE